MRVDYPRRPARAPAGRPEGPAGRGPPSSRSSRDAAAGRRGGCGSGGSRRLVVAGSCLGSRVRADRCARGGFPTSAGLVPRHPTRSHDYEPTGRMPESRRTAGALRGSSCANAVDGRACPLLPLVYGRPEPLSRRTSSWPRAGRKLRRPCSARRADLVTVGHASITPSNDFPEPPPAQDAVGGGCGRLAPDARGPRFGRSPWPVRPGRAAIRSFASRICSTGELSENRDVSVAVRAELRNRG